MSLNKQMIMFVISILLITLLGTFALNFNQTKTFLESQLKSHAQDTATSLGLSLSSVADIEEPASMETMINAVFDRGDFAVISLVNNDEESIFFRAVTRDVSGVPSWFVNMVPIPAPPAHALIQSGWIPVGTLTVKSNAGFAYLKLWESTIAIAIWFLLAMIVTILIAYFAIQFMLKPLKKLERQAEAIVRKEYIIQKDIPRTIEFRRVVLAMNSMVKQLKYIFDRDAKTAARLQKMAHQDKVTGLSNRAHFDMNIESLLDSSTDASAGVMCMIRIHRLKELNDKFGYLTGDKFIELLANKLRSTFDKKTTFNARLNGVEFITVAPSETSDFVFNAMQSIYDHIPTISKVLNAQEKYLDISIGIIDYHPGEKRQNLLAQLDYAVDQAQKLSNNCLHYESNKTQDLSDKQWQTTIDYAINNKQFMFFQQSAYDINNKPYFKELFIRLKDELGNIHSAGYFMPAVNRLKKEYQIDQLVIEMLIEYLNSSDYSVDERLAINLSPVIIENGSFIQLIKDKLNLINPHNLSFEISDIFVINNQNAVMPVIEELKKLGINFGIDSFGSSFSDLSYLQKLRPNYIKLDASFSKAIDENEQTRAYVASLVDMCESLGIDVIAMSVENKQQQQAFAALKVSLYQGYLFNAPKSLLNLL